MAHDLFEQLAEVEVPPVPERFDSHVHERLNRRLLTLHVLEVLLKALPFAWLHFAAAVGALLKLTLTGRTDSPDKPTQN